MSRYAASQETGLLRGWSSPLAKTALLLGLGVHLMGFLLFRVSPETESAVQQTDAFVTYAGNNTTGSGAIVREQALLFDSEPLFIPTDWNVARVGKPPAPTPDVTSELEGWNVAESLASGDALAKAGAYATAAVPRKPVELLWKSGEELLQAYGRQNTARGNLEPRQALAIVRKVETGGAVHEAILRGEGYKQLSEQLWQPVQMSAYVDISGLVGEPLLRTSSGNDAIDALLLEWAAGQRFWSTLAPGYYMLSIGS